MTSYKFKRLSWLILGFLLSIIVAAVFGFAIERWFEIVMGIYIVAGIVYMFLPERK